MSNVIEFRAKQEAHISEYTVRGRASTPCKLRLTRIRTGSRKEVRPLSQRECHRSPGPKEQSAKHPPPAKTSSPNTHVEVRTCKTATEKLRHADNLPRYSACAGLISCFCLATRLDNLVPHCADLVTRQWTLTVQAERMGDNAGRQKRTNSWPNHPR